MTVQLAVFVMLLPGCQLSLAFCFALPAFVRLSCFKPIEMQDGRICDLFLLELNW